MDLPLLEEAKEEVGGIGGDCPPVTGLVGAWRLFLEESRRVWWVAGPMIVTGIITSCMDSSLQIFAGHLGSLELSAVSIGFTITVTLSSGALIGMASALETLCGQAFGACQVKMLGIYMQRSWIILTICAILLTPIYIFTTPILKLLGQEDEISTLAGRFTTLLIPQAYAYAIECPMQKFLQAQSKVVVFAWIWFAALLAHVGLLWLFIYLFGWGLTGAAAAYNISYWLATVFHLLYITGWCQDAWSGISWDAFKEMRAFLTLSLSSAVMLCLEVWYAVVLLVITGLLDNADILVGSFSVCLNIIAWESVLLSGISSALSVRVANELGSACPTGAKYSILVVGLTSLMFGFLCMGLILATRDHFAIIFSTDGELQEAIAKMSYFLALHIFLNCIQSTISGATIGAGWQDLMAYIDLGCNYVIGISLGVILAYMLHWGVQGIWCGMICGAALKIAIMSILMWKTNWKNEAKRAFQRLESLGGQKKIINFLS